MILLQAPPHFVPFRCAPLQLNLNDNYGLKSVVTFTGTSIIPGLKSGAMVTGIYIYFRPKVRLGLLSTFPFQLSPFNFSLSTFHFQLTLNP
jgi:hypothetical protein